MNQAVVNKADFFLPITKIDLEQHMAWGWASTPTKDLQEEIVSIDALKEAVPGYLEWRNVREMHTNSAVGVTKESRLDEHGWYVGTKITDSQAWQKVVDGVYKGYSIGGERLAKVGDVITKLRILELSLVDRPANPDCRIEVFKAAGYAEDGLSRPAAPASKVEPVGSEGMGGIESPPTPEARRNKVTEALKAIWGWMQAEDPNIGDLELKPRNTPTSRQPNDGDDDGNSEPEDQDKEAAAEGSYWKREFSDKQRSHLASTGAALPDGSYPIENERDLHNAIQAFGRNPTDRVKNHIKRRAKELGHEDKLPDNWEKAVTIADLEKKIEQLSAKLAGLTGKTVEVPEGDRPLPITEGVLNKMGITDPNIRKRVAAAHKAALSKAMHHFGKSAGFMGKAAHHLGLAKAMCKAAEGDMQKAESISGHLTNAENAISDGQEHHEMGMMHLGKVASGWTGEKEEGPTDSSEFHTPTGEVEDISQSHLSEGEVPDYPADEPYPKQMSAMARKIKQLNKQLEEKNQLQMVEIEGIGKVPLTPEIARLMEKNAELKGRNEALSRVPNRPRTARFDVRSGWELAPSGAPQAAPGLEKMYEGVDPEDQGAPAKVIGNMIRNNMGKSVFSPDFHGGAADAGPTLPAFRRN